MAYLLFMAWRTLREHGVLAPTEDTHARSSLDVIVSAILVNLLNPKLSIFFFAFLPQFASGPGEMIELSLVFMAVTFAVFAAYASSLLRCGSM